MERILGVIENVQTKPPRAWTQKSCDLIFTDQRMLCIKVGGSSLGGPSGAIAFSMDSHNGQEHNRGKMKENGLDELLAREEENYAIWYKNVSSGSFKTGFFATLGMMAPFEIKTTEGRKYFYNIYNNQ